MILAARLKAVQALVDAKVKVGPQSDGFSCRTKNNLLQGTG